MAKQFQHVNGFRRVSRRPYVVLTLVRPFGPSEACEMQRLIPTALIAASGRGRDFVAQQWRAMRADVVEYRFKHGVASESW